EDGVIDADGGDQQQAEQAEQGQRLAQPAKAGQGGQRRQQRQADHPQGATEAEGQAQQQDDRRARDQLEFDGADLGGAEQAVELAQAIDQHHAFQSLAQAIQNARVVEPLQADDGRHALLAAPQPERAPGFAQRPGEHLFQRQGGCVQQLVQFGAQGGFRQAQLEQGLPVLRQAGQGLAQRVPV